MLEKSPAVGIKRQPLWHRLYNEPCYIDLARFIGYGGKSLAEAQKFVLELETKYGRAKVIEAGEALSKAEGKGKADRLPDCRGPAPGVATSRPATGSAAALERG